MDPKCRLVAKGVKNISVDELKKIFKSDKVELIGKGSKVAFIQYENSQQITKIYDSVRNLRVNGKNIKVEYCIPKDKYEERKNKKVKLSTNLNKYTNLSEDNKLGEHTKLDKHNQKNKHTKLDEHKNKDKHNQKNKHTKLDEHKDKHNQKDKHKNKLDKHNQKNKHTKLDKHNKIIFYRNENDFLNCKKKHLIFLKNLFFTITDEKITELFKKYGKIKNIERKYTDENRFNGRATVEFINAPTDEIFEDEIFFEHLLIEVEGEKIQKGDNHRIFISNILKTVKPKDILNLLKENGIRGTVNMKLDGLKKRNYGYCHIQFSSEEDEILFKDNFSKFEKLGKISFEKAK